MAEELVSGRREDLLLQPGQQPGPSLAFLQPWKQLCKPWEGPLSLPRADWRQRRSGVGLLSCRAPAAAGRTASASS